MSDTTKDKLVVFILIAVGIGSIGNALWMLAGPFSWYKDLPAGIPDFGDYNVHFVRDLGCAFLGMGLALFWAARNKTFRFPLIFSSAIFYGLHAINHVWDTLRGHVGHDHWFIDLPLSYLPALLLVPATIHCYNQTKRSMGDE